MNRINRLFHKRSGNILSIYFTAGFPSLDSTVPIIRSLAAAGADMIEIGIPFSDPMADGPVIQQSSDRALRNGMSLSRLFHQLKDIREDLEIPLLLMGYLNPVMQYGVEKFCEDCAGTGIDGVILPDLPPEVFAGDARLLARTSSDRRREDGMTGPEGQRQEEGQAGQGQEERTVGQGTETFPDQRSTSIQELFSSHNLHNVFLISPQTGTERIRQIDSLSGGFIYMVSTSSTTGVKGAFTAEQTAYFRRIRNMDLANPLMIGFGISDHASFSAACEQARGAIIGSAFVRMLSDAGASEQHITGFIRKIREGYDEGKKR